MLAEDAGIDNTSKGHSNIGYWSLGCWQRILDCKGCWNIGYLERILGFRV